MILPIALVLLISLTPAGSAMAAGAPDLGAGPAYPRYEALEFADLEESGYSQAAVRAQVGKLVRGRSLAIFGQGAFEVAAHWSGDDPQALVRIAADSNANCEIGWYVSALQVPLTQPPRGQFVYSPFALELSEWIQKADSWLRDSSGKIIEGAKGWGVFDVRARGFADFYGSHAHDWMQRYGIRRIFLDETHGSLGFLPAYSSTVNPPTDAEQVAGVSSMLMAAAHGDPAAVLWNGTLPISSCPEAFGGRMLQRAWSSSYASISSQMRTVIDRWGIGQRHCLLEQPSLSPDQAAYVVCLSALYDGSSGCGNATFTDPDLKMPWASGSFGRPVEYVSHTSTVPVLTMAGGSVTREFEHATVGIDTLSKSAFVNYH